MTNPGAVKVDAKEAAEELAARFMKRPLEPREFEQFVMTHGKGAIGLFRHSAEQKGVAPERFMALGL